MREELIDCLFQYWLDQCPDATKAQEKLQWNRFCQYSTDELKKTCIELGLVSNNFQAESSGRDEYADEQYYEDY